MNNQSTALEGGAMPSAHKFNPLTTDAIAKSIKAMEYDMAKERVEPYIVDMSKQLPEVLPLVSINGSCLCSVGNISAVCGEAKSRKTFLTSGLVASAMALPYGKLNNFGIVDKNHNLDVLWVDTEQGEMHVRKVVERISTMTGAKMGGLLSEPRLTTLALRELAPLERKQRMYDAMMLMHYDLVVIDGIADLQRNTNDLEESDALVTELMTLSTIAQTHILCVLFRA
ncbi:MAG: AAA family ATPase [Alistipes sp.]|nr:AAA family ATPase [Alistipes sp.]